MSPLYETSCLFPLIFSSTSVIALLQLEHYIQTNQVRNDYCMPALIMNCVITLKIIKNAIKKCA